MDFFKINGKIIRAPTDLTVSPEVLDKTERTIDGTLVVDIIGTKKKVDVSWEYLPAADMQILAEACGDEGFQTIEFHDNQTGALVQMTGRSEGLTYSPHYDWAKAKIMWKSVSVSFKEK